MKKSIMVMLVMLVMLVMFSASAFANCYTMKDNSDGSVTVKKYHTTRSGGALIKYSTVTYWSCELAQAMTEGMSNCPPEE